MKKLVLLFITVLLLNGCERKFGEFYDPPEGLEGDIYTQLSTDPDLSTFVSAMEKVPGLKEELSSSGLFTVMAPDNEAFNKFFASHSSYHSIDDIPVETLESLVKFHIMKWMIFRDQFLGMNTPDIFKYETRSTASYKESGTSGSKAIFYTPKNMQVYTPNFLDHYNVLTTDYTEVYGNNSQINTDMKLNVMGASVKAIDIAAGNGVYYIIDRVLVPPLNIAQELETNEEYADYFTLLKKRFVSYTYDKAGTIAQGNHGDVDGDGVIDSLWIRQFATEPNLDVENPKTANKKSLLSLTAFIPSGKAFSEYMKTRLLPNFRNDPDSIPEPTLSLLYSSHITNSMDWPSKIDRKQVVNILGDNLSVGRADIESVEMKSNGLFYKTNRVIEPKIFNAAPGPVFFSPDYTYFSRMIQSTGLMSSLSSDGMEYTVFAPTNEAFNEQNIVWLEHPDKGSPGFYRVKESSDPSSISTKELTSILGNHIVLNKSISTDKMENGFYQTQNSRYVVVDGGRIYGSDREFIPEFIEKDRRMSNGYFHSIDKMLLPPKYTVYSAVSSATRSEADTVNYQYMKFKELCSAADILKTDFVDITSANSEKKFTLFVPSNEAIIAAQLAGLLPLTGNEGSTTLTADGKAKLAKYLRTFFVADKEIFTDGKLTGTFSTRNKNTAESTIGNDVFYAMSVFKEGNGLKVTMGDGTSAYADLSDPVGHPQNMICEDGIIHVIDNVFISYYK
ncbi:fasciclin domain-containing protein [Parabacteroides pacaensis]|uniref:fasciclin domain-containing protein n=1 Tax=Parabacteroides pacaensis TaxID=2086575 RepID=UPI000D0F9755|nr:fasciclin domain-containing protein [Parabacteroides pacaensis]